MTKLRIEQPVLQIPVVGQQQQAFAIGIQPPGRIHAGHGDEVFQSLSSRARGVGELCQHTVRLVKKQVAQNYRFGITNTSPG